jgi:CheY-like chemotaxis protein/two-component sensor histidine kinase
LRTPLNSILLLSRLMSDNPEKNLSTDQVEYARVIQSSGHGLLSLIDEILDLSKIEAGKMQLEYQSVSVSSVVSDMRALFQPLADEKKIKFESVVAGNVPGILETDKLRLEQVLKNLLSNAIKFTAEGSVTLTIQPDDARDGYVRFSVADTGIGIAEDKQSLVFEAFQQADGSTRRKYGGTGLGLSISRELVKLLGGEIHVKSEPGGGSEFSFYIPLSREVLQRRDVVEKPKSAPVVTAPEPVVVNKFISTVIPQNIPDDRHEITKADKVILIVEDDPNFGKSLLDFTRKKGYKGIVAVRGDEGIDLAREFLPLGILLDLQLPVKSGWQVMEELKNNPQTRHIPVHIMSSYSSKNESLLKGAVDFIDKPVDVDQMQDIFKKIEYVLTHHPKKVLIVEENARHAKALAYFLETFEVSLEITSEVNDAIESLKDKEVNCVILDMGIPDQKSYDTLEVIRKTPGLETLPIIIFTGKSLSQGEQLKIKQYADSVVIKTAHSYKRILDEVSLFLHLMEKKDEPDNTPRFHKLGMLDDILKNKVILVADDDMRNIFSLTKALEKYQVKVIPAVDGKDALQKLNANPDVDIVLMDMMMPEMDGYESTRAIRKLRKFKDLPVIAVTAKAMMGDREKCINAGASDYITKPVDVDQLFSLLRVWLYEKGVK